MSDNTYALTRERGVGALLFRPDGSKIVIERDMIPWHITALLWIYLQEGGSPDLYEPYLSEASVTALAHTSSLNPEVQKLIPVVQLTETQSSSDGISTRIEPQTHCASSDKSGSQSGMEAKKDIPMKASK